MLTVEKLYEVEKGMNERLSMSEDCRKRMERVKEESKSCIQIDQGMEDKMLDAMEEIQVCRTKIFFSCFLDISIWL